MTETATVEAVPSAKRVPAGTMISTSTTALEVMAARSIGAVATLDTVPSVSGAPNRVTAEGSALTAVRTSPAGGLPTKLGATGTVFDVSAVLTSISTVAVPGDSSTAVTGCPSTSTGTRSTCSETSMPDGSIRTRASARVTSRRRLSGPWPGPSSG